MAVVQYTAAVNQIRGKLNGSVFNKYKTGYSLQRKQHPPIGARGNQLAVRSGYSAIQRRWKALSDNQRLSWQTTAAANPATNRFGEQVTLSGYNQFIKCGLLCNAVGATTPSSGFAAPAPGGTISNLDVSSLTLSVNNNGETIMSGNVEADVSLSGSGHYFTLDVSLPTSAGVTVYHQGWRALEAWPVFGNISEGFAGNLGNRYPSIYPGARLRFRARLFHRPSGVIVYTSELIVDAPETSSISSWSVPATSPSISPPVTIAYSPASTGFPLFMHVEVYATLPLSSPPSQSEAVIRQYEIESELEVANVGSQDSNAFNGAYVGYLARLVWSPTGEVLDEQYAVYQRVF